MRIPLLALAASVAFAVPAAEAEPIRTRVYVAPYPAWLDSDEAREDRLEHLERRQEVERHALRMHQRAERRMVDPDED